MKNNIETKLILEAYRKGLFPMAESKYNAEIFWVDPEHRGVLMLDKVRIPRRFKKTLKKKFLKLR